MLETIDISQCSPMINVYAPGEAEHAVIAGNLPGEFRSIINRANNLVDMATAAKQHRYSFSIVYSDGESAEEVCRYLVDVIRSHGRHAAVVVGSLDAVCSEFAFRAAGAFAVCGLGKWPAPVRRSTANFCRLRIAGNPPTVSVEQKIILSLPWRPVRLGTPRGPR